MPEPKAPEDPEQMTEVKPEGEIADASLDGVAGGAMSLNSLATNSLATNSMATNALSKNPPPPKVPPGR